MTPQTHPLRTARTPRTLLALGALLVFVACGGGGGGGGGTPLAPPSNLAYPIDPGLYRVNEAIADNTPSVSGGAVASYAISPALPGGLGLDPTTGVISGTPSAEASSTSYVVTATNAAGSTQAALDIAVGAALPAAFGTLMDGFQAEALFTTPDVSGVVKMVRVPDGRILFVEKDTGWIRAWSPTSGLQAAAYVDLSSVLLGADTWTLLTGSHRGLIAITTHPDFNANGFLYVMLSVENTMLMQQKTIVLRFTDDPTNNVGMAQAMVLDNLPTASTNNGGELVFDAAGQHLFVSMGDAEDAPSAQADVDVGTPSTLAGKILRLVPDAPATVPATNASGTFEWVRGVRNCYGMAVHPVTAGLFAVDTEGMDLATGFSMLDELNFIVEGKNFEWGAAAGTIPGGSQGFTAWDSPNLTVTPTSLAWHTGAGFSTPDSDTLLMGWYNANTLAQPVGHSIRAFTMTGVVRADVDLEQDFARINAAQGNEPLDLYVDAATGDIYLVLLAGVYRISAIQ